MPEILPRAHIDCWKKLAKVLINLEICVIMHLRRKLNKLFSVSVRFYFGKNAGSFPHGLIGESFNLRRSNQSRIFYGA